MNGPAWGGIDPDIGIDKIEEELFDRDEADSKVRVIADVEFVD